MRIGQTVTYTDAQGSRPGVITAVRHSGDPLVAHALDLAVEGRGVTDVSHVTVAQPGAPCWTLSTEAAPVRASAPVSFASHEEA